MSDVEPEPPEARLLKLIGGYRVTQALYVRTKLGIPDSLSGGPKDAIRLAEEVGAQPDRLYRLLRALASLDVLTMDERARFGLTDTGRLLVSDPKGSMALTSIFAGEEPYRAWGGLMHSVRTGETAFDHVFGMGHFDFLAQHPSAAATFNKLMAWSVGIAGDPLEGYDLGRHGTLVDVGGGKGALISSVLRAHPRPRGILFDQPSAVVEAPALLQSSGVADRCEIRTGSAFDSVPSGGDVYVLSRVLHDWSGEKALRLLVNCRRAMSKGCALLIIDGVLREGDLSPSRLWLDLVMMVMTGGHERAEAEWVALLEKSRFSIIAIRASRPNQDLIEARAI
ncbi:MAG: methyltransferase [Thermoplasmata archaeon]